MIAECFNSYIESDVKTLSENYKTIQKHVGPNKVVVPVLKANAYGFGDVEAAKAVIPLGANLIAVAQVCEGVHLRKEGIDIPILVLGGVSPNNIPYAVEYDIQTIVFTEENATRINEEAKKQGKIASVQLKLDTGMHRVGVVPGEKLAKFIEFAKTLTNIKIVGTFTHFACAETVNDPFTLEQYELFKKGVEQIKADGFIDLKYIHCQNSGATSWLKDDICTHCRPGAMMYGYCRLTDGTKLVPVEESMSLHGFITAINDVPVGESVGYDRHFMATKPSRIATVGMGYGDAVYRPLAMNGGPVLVNDTKTHYVGVCMDQLFVDVTDIDCKVGDEITVFGHSKGGAFLSAFEVADFASTIYQILVSVNTARVGRVYKY